jgi:hypothetical protein
VSSANPAIAPFGKRGIARSFGEKPASSGSKDFEWEAITVRREVVATRGDAVGKYLIERYVTCGTEF